ncbi:ATP-binding protein [Streptomyces triticirhizae]|uniref:ATP-binding protein n=1 Tax=Streptomyces triticirhizae TaxID=2483353 RepID=A0A3M2MAW3_9ACTN|nr:ATP-binding protein [Streptomyces triticirhizae]RMI46003.1 ATP-binding protein [Streptomyces triticirhizae]
MIIVPQPAAELGVYSWQLTARARDFERWRAIAGAVVSRLGGDAEAVELARLGVSELLCNVVKHVAHDPRCRLKITREGERIRVSVNDRSSHVPKAAVPDWSSESGRGLWLLGQMAEEWGYSPAGEGKSVWFRFPVAGRRAT